MAGKTSSGKYLLVELTDKEWSWERFSVENLINVSDKDIFYFISALGQGLGSLERNWKKGNKEEKENILAWLDSCLIHCYHTMLITENPARFSLFSALVSFLMNYIECFRMIHKIKSSDVVVRVWAESMKIKKQSKN